MVTKTFKDKINHITNDEFNRGSNTRCIYKNMYIFKSYVQCLYRIIRHCIQRFVCTVYLASNYSAQNASALND